MDTFRVLTLILIINTYLFSFSDECLDSYRIDKDYITVNKDERGLFLINKFRKGRGFVGKNYIAKDDICLTDTNKENRAIRFIIENRDVKSLKVKDIELFSRSSVDNRVNELKDLIFKIDGKDYFVNIKSEKKRVFYLSDTINEILTDTLSSIVKKDIKELKNSSLVSLDIKDNKFLINKDFIREENEYK